ncbi:S-layer homology domain-containing protein, partial [Candidatus Gracilibacteria bacterium]|nr:S-layer homology domain-containing protein [Candidatus Gracilibacteria bacterium]
MLKKILILIITFSFLVSGYFFFGNNISAGSIKVENIFSDINSNYKYLNELQTLYDRGMISPDKDGKFNPKALLNRDEFVGILMEVTCKKCIQPNTSIDLINKYSSSQGFYDINKFNKYFYCVEDANDSGFVKGYHPGTTCENGVQRDGEKPFCPSNIIILEE